jgi:hypothetical protein
MIFGVRAARLGMRLLVGHALAHLYNRFPLRLTGRPLMSLSAIGAQFHGRNLRLFSICATASLRFF